MRKATGLVTITEKLFLPLLAQPARPLITYYDDGDGTRMELSRATVANWAAKTANWLRDECDVEPGGAVAVRVPAHWQTVGVLLGAWWAGARVTDDPAGAQVAFVPPGEPAPGAETVAVVALDPFGRGFAQPPTDGTVDYLNEVRVFGDDFTPWQPLPGSTPALLNATVDDVLAATKDRAHTLGLSPGSRVLSTLDWTLPDGVLSGLLAILAADASLVQCARPDLTKLDDRARTERTTLTLSAS